MLARLLINMAALGLATWVVPGIELTQVGLADKTISLALVAIIFGVANTIVKPLFTIITAPLIVLTLGLMLLVINATLLGVTSWGAGIFDLGWHVDGFFSALLGSIIVSVVSFVLNVFFGGKK